MCGSITNQKPKTNGYSSTHDTQEGRNRIYRLYSEGWQTGKELLNGLQTVDKRRNNQRPSEQYAQPLLESKIYDARRTRIEAPARSTILRRVGLLEALSSIARSSLILFVVDFWPLLKSILRFKQTLNVKCFKERGGSTSLVPPVSHT